MNADGSEPRFDAFRALAERRGRPGTRLIEALKESGPGPLEEAGGRARAVASRWRLPAAAALGPASYFADLSVPPGRRRIRLCTAAACFAATGGRHVRETEERLGVTCDSATPDGATSLQAVRCLGYCYAAPAALDGGTPCTGPELAGRLAGGGAPAAPDIPAADATGDPVLLGRIVNGGPAWQVWPGTVTGAAADRVLAEVAASGLRGRGGAGFEVAAKWRATGRGPGTVVVANGDEGDPGSYADRLLMEEDPELVLEGLALACFACGAERGIVLVRSEYPRAAARMREAVVRAYDAGHFGPSVHATGTSLEVAVAEGAGSYVTGEETALIASLEGGRGCARPRPPYPTRHGLWDAPTVVNNVETLAAVPWIVRRGGAAYARRGTPRETGTKIVCLSEGFARPGAYEIELGTPVERITAGLGGGMRDGRRAAVLQIGGPLGGFLAADALDVPLAQEALARRGASLGHAGLVAFDERLDPVAVLRHVWEFAAAESCGACSPCRVGSRRGLELVSGRARDTAEYRRLLRLLSEASLCAFGRGIPGAVLSLARAYGVRLAGWDG
ncbi:NAD(P)H-dependent oxidoreductase subunit E [Streptomyces meridianus]|uniref:NAD(P)H-dependent oxidoreductase subunit E n=1 Tax=Streptomyces meridianus TaxID=2938945 RepID=A0ABT0XB58_9ACTN|nr:NAD(P)H-dependent oxidoreductase subunit E [Streptomyces meridianus]MCM2579746.1 NAD(P)H-dependent oxidoreductase subunit E [Streptomyces meridianus]